ncbi:Rieske 2Fe-2S domain-containing protein [Pigmentiphaga kullae]|uniref:Phenylpropionate dioxygenase-like ring-hydroxylating dioxygenase large terminal subunit n=1 Tax=Pigmentiphaga kullae TaxID=151784 RepID=A0A4Q7NN14_9BURK|nr:Rieske 2Fe-2S domain-containing protein [Pigmentiphaga kullae]RZS86605.1 phenylpropionate dioxygenase-like ring-hydroxylating dioxygenase large terminal subunit [Pigmentiphaga kullae]
MLSIKDNEELTRVGPGTLMGDLFRRFWLPALLSRELPESDGVPVRLRILGEDLIAFRNSSGSVGIIGAYCSHRRAPLFFGRNEEEGIRCPYHGWKFGVDGKCMEAPNAGERDGEGLRSRLSISGYPTREQGGLVWVYMGPPESTPDMPSFEWLGLPSEHVHVSRWLQRSNFMQGVEGEIDSSHISFLHKEYADVGNNKSVRIASADGAPHVAIKETPYGFMSGARRSLDNRHYWRVTHWLLPTYSAVPRSTGTNFTVGGGRIWVPVDDDNVTTFAVSYRVDASLSSRELGLIESGKGFPPRATRTTVTLAGGQRIDTFLPDANIDNDYLVDRNHQKFMNFTGIWGANEQDRSLQESMQRGALGQTVDRSIEHLVAADAAIVAARRRLLKVARDLRAESISPVPPGDTYAVRALSEFSEYDDFNSFVSQFGQVMRAPVHNGGNQ